MNPSREIGVIVGATFLLGIALLVLNSFGNALGAGNAQNSVLYLGSILGNTQYLTLVGVVFIVILAAWAWSVYEKSHIGQNGK